MRTDRSLSPGLFDRGGRYESKKLPQPRLFFAELARSAAIRLVGAIRRVERRVGLRAGRVVALPVRGAGAGDCFETRLRRRGSRAALCANLPRPAAVRLISAVGLAERMVEIGAGFNIGGGAGRLGRTCVASASSAAVLSGGGLGEFRAGVNATLTPPWSSKGVAWVINTFQIEAGSEPPTTFFIGASSSSPSQTPTTSGRLKPTNQASR